MDPICKTDEDLDNPGDLATDKDLALRYSLTILPSLTSTKIELLSLQRRQQKSTQARKNETAAIFFPLGKKKMCLATINCRRLSLSPYCPLISCLSLFDRNSGHLILC
jgi:hypothetical protein